MQKPPSQGPPSAILGDPREVAQQRLRNEAAVEELAQQAPAFYWSKMGTQNGTLANGNMDFNLRSFGGLILTRPHSISFR